MAERTGDYEWRIEGEAAEAVLYAPDEAALEYPRLRSGLDAATGLPGVESPVYAAASPRGYGLVAASSSHVAPGLVSAPRVGLLLVAGSPVDRLGLPPEDLPRLLARSLSEVSMPSLSEPELRAACESGAVWAAGEALLGEEDLAPLGASGGDPDALGRRALAVGSREWDPRPGADVRVYGVGEMPGSATADSLGLYRGALVVVASVVTGDLGRLALEGHRQRISRRDFGDPGTVAAAPRGTEEAADLIAATDAASGYAAARASLLIYALRRALEESVGALDLAASWSLGGFEERGGATLHRRSLARLRRGDALVCGETVASGTGAMLDSAPTFDSEGEREWPWEESGLLESAALLRPPGDTKRG